METTQASKKTPWPIFFFNKRMAFVLFIFLFGCVFFFQAVIFIQLSELNKQIGLLSTLQSAYQDIKQMAFTQQKQLITMQSTLNEQKQAFSLKLQHLKHTSPLFSLKNKKLFYNEKITYYLEMASIAFNVQHDKDAALQMLSLANTLVLTHPDKDNQTLRQQLDNDIQHIKALNFQDNTPLLQTLSNLSLAMNTLPVEFPKLTQAPIVTQPTSAFKDKLNAILHHLKSFIVIRYHTNEEKRILSPLTAQTFLSELQLYRELAIWAIMEQNNRLFHSTIESLITQIRAHTITNHPSTMALLTTLQSLSTATIHPPIRYELTSLSFIKTISRKDLET
jgi:uncharacterized protein HemX